MAASPTSTFLRGYGSQPQDNITFVDTPAFAPRAFAVAMTRIASQAGLSREKLYRSFSETGNPTQ